MSAYIPRAARYRLDVPLRYRVAGSDRWQEGQTVNVSGTGVLVQVAEFLAPEMLFEMAAVGFASWRTVRRCRRSRDPLSISTGSPGCASTTS